MKNRRGVSFPEVLMVVLVMVPVLLLCLTVFIKQVQSVTETWDETMATALGQRCMARVQARPYSSIPTGSVQTDTELSSLFNRFGCTWRADLVDVNWTAIPPSITLNTVPPEDALRIVATVSKDGVVKSTLTALMTP